MFATGLYKDECRDWNKLQVPARTWPAFKAIFLAANKEIREMQARTGNNGYSNNVTQDLFEQTAGALTRIVDANATDRDREEVANLVINNGITQQQVTAITTTLAAITARLTAIEVNNGNGNGNNSNNGGGGNSTRRTRGNGGSSTDESYCHTHGRTRRPDHTSATCQHQHEGHQLTATLSGR